MAEMTEQRMLDMNAALDKFTSEVEDKAKGTRLLYEDMQRVIFETRKMIAQNNEAYDKIMRQYEQDVPSFLDQTGWETGLWDIKCRNGQIFFNPTCIEFNGQRWLVTRDAFIDTRKPVPFNTFSQITIFRLDDTEIVSDAFTIPIPKGRKGDEQWEDPRILWSGHQLWLSCCNFIQGKTGAHQAFVILDPAWKPLSILHPVYGNNGPSVISNRGNEKNWLWFKHTDGHPYMVYQNEPHKVVKMASDLQPMEEWETSLPPGTDIWQHFERRGGTNPILIDGEYWSFFHSSTPWWGGRRRYYMGAYAFKAEPPFNVTRYTPRPLLSGSLRDPRLLDFPVVVFPGGHIYEEDTGKHFVVLGINDCKCGWIKIPHVDLKEITIDVYDHNKKKTQQPEKSTGHKKAKSKTRSRKAPGGSLAIGGVEKKQGSRRGCKGADNDSPLRSNAKDGVRRKSAKKKAARS